MPWQDPHNTDPAFTRVRLRREVLPLLEEVLGGGVRAALGRTAELMAQDLQALDEMAAAVLEQVTFADGSLDAAALAAQPGGDRAGCCGAGRPRGGAGPLTYEHLQPDGSPGRTAAARRRCGCPAGSTCSWTGRVLRPATASGAADRVGVAGAMASSAEQRPDSPNHCPTDRGEP